MRSMRTTTGASTSPTRSSSFARSSHRARPHHHPSPTEDTIRRPTRSSAMARAAWIRRSPERPGPPDRRFGRAPFPCAKASVTMRAMQREARWRVISDYIGAGRFVVEPDRVIVGTGNGVECVPRPGKTEIDGWRVGCGSRSIGVQRFEDGSILASCRGGLLLLTGEGEECREKVFADQLSYEAVPLDASRPDGHREILVAHGTSLALYRDWEPV